MMTQARASTRLLGSDVIAPKIYTENESDIFQLENILTLIDVFPSRSETRDAILELRRQGLPASQIVVITQNYQEYENSINWEYVTKDGNLLEVLTGLGVDIHHTSKFENAVKNGNFLVAAIIVNKSVSQAQCLLENIGHKVISVY